MRCDATTPNLLALSAPSRSFRLRDQRRSSMIPSIRRLALAIAALLTVTLALGGAVVAAPNDTAEVIERLKAQELARLQAIVDGDAATVEPLLAESFVLVPPPGLPLTKDEYLGAIASGSIDYRDFHPVSPIEVRFYGQAAVISYRSYIDVTVVGLGSFQAEVWHTFVAEHREGRWQVVREQATSVGGFPPP